MQQKTIRRGVLEQGYLLSASLALNAHEGGDLTVEHEHEGGTGAAEHVGAGTLEHGLCTLVRDDLLGAVDGALVHALIEGQLGLHLHAAADSVEGVGDEAGHDDGELGTSPLGGDAAQGGLLVPGVQALDGVVQAELDTTVGDDTSDGDTEAVVEGQDALGAVGRLLEAVPETFEGLLAGSDIGGKTGTSVVERVHEGKGEGTSSTTRSHVDGKEGPELSLGVLLGEESLDSILGGQVDGLGGEVADAVGEVATPEGANTLLGSDALEAVADAGVALHLTRLDLGVSILGLDDKLHTLDGSGDGLGNGTCEGTREGGERKFPKKVRGRVAKKKEVSENSVRGAGESVRAGNQARKEEMNKEKNINGADNRVFSAACSTCAKVAFWG